MNNEYCPDKWCILKISHTDTFFKVFGAWSGSYLGCDSWRMNSGITEVIEDEDHYVFVGASGSEYKCHKEMYGNTIFGAGVLKGYIDKYGEVITIMPEDDWYDAVMNNLIEQ